MKTFIMIPQQNAPSPHVIHDQLPRKKIQVKNNVCFHWTEIHDVNQIKFSFSTVYSLHDFTYALNCVQVDNSVLCVLSFVIYLFVSFFV